MSVIIEFIRSAYNSVAQGFLPWLATSGLQIVLIIIGAAVAKIVIHIVVAKAVRKMVRGYASKQAELKRENTLIKIFHKTISAIVWLTALLMILSELGINIGPLLAGAGVAGLAFGFGGQYLIRDIISGLFIILENQFRVGDVVCLDGTCGSIEDVTLRLTILRDLDGTVHHVPNGEIKKTSNLSKDFSRVNLDIGVSYSADLEKVEKVVNEVGKKLSEEEPWKDYIKSPPHFYRVNDFADSAVMVKILGETEPLRQWSVTGELRKRLKIAFDKEGIEIPFPQRVVHQGKG